MKTIYKLSFAMLLATLLPFSAGAQTLAAEEFSIEAGKSATLAVSLENSGVVVTALQFDITLPEGLSVTKSEKTERVGDLDLYTNYNPLDNPGNVYRFAIFPDLGKSISGESGVIVNITVEADASFAGGEITFSNIELVKQDGSSVEPEEFNVTATAEEGSSDDTIGLSIETPEIKAGQETILPVELNNKDFEVTFVGFDVTLPEGLAVTNAELTGRKASSHKITWNSLTSGDYRVIISSLGNEIFNEESGAICNLTIKAAEEVKAGSIKLHDIQIISPDEVKIEPDTVEEEIPATSTGINTISSDSQNGEAYSLQGVKMGKNLKKGIYIINGKKVVK